MSEARGGQADLLQGARVPLEEVANDPAVALLKAFEATDGFLARAKAACMGQEALDGLPQIARNLVPVGTKGRLEHTLRG